MQNQIQYGNYNTNNPQIGIGSPKYTSLNYIKTSDKTLPPPTNNLRHYSSNPNLSLEQLNLRPQTSVEHVYNNQPQINKNIEFRAQQHNMNIGFNSTQATNPRAARNLMTQSLLLSEN